MRKILIPIVFLLIAIILSGCNNISQLLEEDQNVQTTEAPSNIALVQDFANDCSKVVIPTNVSRNTLLNVEEELITVHWLDQTTAEDVGIIYKYTDQNCSESAKEMTAHLMEEQNVQTTEALAEKPPEMQPKIPIVTEIIEGINDWEGNREIKYTNGWVKQLQGEIEGDFISVAAGAFREDPKQGVLHIAINGRGKDSPFFSINNYLSPVKHGALTIEGFNGFFLSLKAEDGSFWEFDVLKGIYRRQRADLRKLVYIPENIKEHVQGRLLQDEGLETYFYQKGKTYVLLKSPNGIMDVTIARLNQEGGQLVTIEYIIGGTRKNEDASVRYSLSELDGEFTVGFKSNDFTKQSLSNEYMDEEQALEAAKSFIGSRSQTKWSARLVEDQEINYNNIEEFYTVWVVEALYPAGNKEIIELDAVTGWQISLTEIEAD